jgi:hypothetical protein
MGRIIGGAGVGAVRSWDWRLRLRTLRPGITPQNDAYYSILMRTISLKLPENLWAQLDCEAKARRVTKSWLLRESLAKALSGESPAGEVSCYDVAHDLAGSVRGLPEDVA